MAVVFISPRKKQKAFFIGITICLGLFLALISMWVFLAQPAAPATEAVFNKPKASLNLGILESAQFKNLEPFLIMPLQFKYVAKTSEDRTVRGYVSAVSREEALEKLASQGLEAEEVIEADVGRENPFVPY